MVGTTRFELATSPTPILETTQSEQLSKIYQYVRERETTQRNAYWTRNGPIDGPTLAHAFDNAARTATSKGPHSLVGKGQGDDPLGGNLFACLWTIGESSGSLTIELAAASLLSGKSALLLLLPASHRRS